MVTSNICTSISSYIHQWSSEAHEQWWCGRSDSLITLSGNTHMTLCISLCGKILPPMTRLFAWQKSRNRPLFSFLTATSLISHNLHKILVILSDFSRHIPKDNQHTMFRDFCRRIMQRQIKLFLLLVGSIVRRRIALDYSKLDCALRRIWLEWFSH